MTEENEIDVSEELLATRERPGLMGGIEKVPSKLLSRDWNEELEDEDCVIQEGRRLPTLKGLQKLARQAGWNGSDSNIIIGGDGRLVSATVTVAFEDGSVFSGSGDCNKNNSKPPYSYYPTAVAESRAMARALKIALGIFELTAEEIGFGDALSGFSSSSGKAVKVKIDPAQIKAVEVALQRRKMDFITVAQEVLEERADELTSLADLTSKEGRDILSFLNSKSVEDNVATSRTARKKELKKQLEEG
jgi:hypothetical protein